MKNNIKPNNVTPIIIEAEAYRNGVLGTPIDDSLAETQAEFDARIAETERDGLENIKNLEAEKNNADLRRDEAKTVWENVKAEVDGKSPYLVSVVIIAFLGFLGFITEAALLQKIADVFGIADPILQYPFAFGVVGFLTLLVDSVIWAWKKPEWINRIAVYVYGGLVLLGLISLGIYRAYVLEDFEAAQSQDLANLFANTFYLNKIVMMFLTVGLPIAVAFALEYSKDGLNLWIRWFKARREAVKFEKLSETATKKFEAAKEKLAKEIEAIRETCESWKAAQRQAHAEGLNGAAIRRPFWEIIGLLIGGSFLILFAVFIIKVVLIDNLIEDETISMLATIPLGAGLIGLFIYYVVKRWNSPTASQFYNQRTVVWRSENAVLTNEEKKVLPKKADILVDNKTLAAKV